MTKHTSRDIVDAIMNGNASDVPKIMSSVLSSKLSDSLELRKSEIEADFFGENAEIIDEEANTYKVSFKDQGFQTVSARTEKEAIAKARKKLGISKRFSLSKPTVTVEENETDENI